MKDQTYSLCGLHHTAMAYSGLLEASKICQAALLTENALRALIDLMTEKACMSPLAEKIRYMRTTYRSFDFWLDDSCARRALGPLEVASATCTGGPF